MSFIIYLLIIRRILLLDIKDIEHNFPELLKSTIEWFKIYKNFYGKPENKFAFNGKHKDCEFALEIINTAHEHWKRLAQTRNTEATKHISWYVRVRYNQARIQVHGDPH